MTRKQRQKSRNKLLNICVIIIDTVVFVRAFFHFAMTLNGSWDDINITTIMVLVSLAVVALFLALINNMHYEGHASYVLASVIVLGLTALLFMYVLMTFSFVGLTAS